MLSVAMAKALWKERKDAIRAMEDTWREIEEERLAEVARLRVELEGTGRSLSLSLLPMDGGLQATLPPCFDVSNLCLCRVEGGSPSFGQAAPKASRGGRQATGPPRHPWYRVIGALDAFRAHLGRLSYPLPQGGA